MEPSKTSTVSGTKITTTFVENGQRPEPKKTIVSRRSAQHGTATRTCYVEGEQ